jgi:hypothetical protein
MKGNGNWRVTRFWLVLVCSVSAVGMPIFIYNGVRTPTENTQIAQGAASCCTQRGQCPLSQPQQAGTRCYCSSSDGPIPGSAC